MASETVSANEGVKWEALSPIGTGLTGSPEEN